MRMLLAWGLAALLAGCTPSSTGPTGTGGTGDGPATKLLEVRIDEDAPPFFTVEKGKSAKHTVKIKREGYQGDLELRFSIPAGAGLTMESAVIPAGKNEAQVTLSAAADARGDEVIIEAVAPGHKPTTLLKQRIRPE